MGLRYRVIWYTKKCWTSHDTVPLSGSRLELQHDIKHISWFLEALVAGQLAGLQAEEGEGGQPVVDRHHHHLLINYTAKTGFFRKFLFWRLRLLYTVCWEWTSVVHFFHDEHLAYTFKHLLSCVRLWEQVLRVPAQHPESLVKMLRVPAQHPQSLVKMLRVPSTHSPW